jgi:hypothetical protein
MTIPADQSQTAVDFAVDLFREAKRVAYLRLRESPIFVLREQAYGPAMNRWKSLR